MLSFVGLIAFPKSREMPSPTFSEASATQVPAAHALSEETISH